MVRRRLLALAIAFGLGTGVTGTAARPAPAAAIDPCFGYDLCIHLSIGSMGLPNEFGSGRVTSSPSGIDCAFSAGAALTSTTTCDHYFHANFVSSISVTLNAVAESGSTVVCDVHVAEATSCADHLTFTASGPAASTFHFGKAPITVTVGNASMPGGFVYSTPMGIDCGEQYTACQHTWPFGTNVTLTAEGDGASFLSWTGSCALNNDTCELGLEYPIDTTAIFGIPATPTPTPKPTATPGPTRSTAPGLTPHPTQPSVTEPTATPPASGGSGGQPGTPSATPRTPADAGTAEPDRASPPDGAGIPPDSGAGVGGSAAGSPGGDAGQPTRAGSTVSSSDSWPIVIAILAGCGLIAIGIVVAAAVTRRERGSPR